MRVFSVMEVLLISKTLILFLLQIKSQRGAQSVQPVVTFRVVKEGKAHCALTCQRSCLTSGDVCVLSHPLPPTRVSPLATRVQAESSLNGGRHRNRKARVWKTFLPCTSSPVQHFPYIIHELSTYCELNLVTVGECPPGSALALQVPGEAAQAFQSDALRYRRGRTW